MLLQRDRYLIAAFRKIFRWEKRRKECKKIGICAKCREVTKDIHVDHINPVIDPKVGWQGWDIYYDRLFNGDLQPLCRPCHKIKTREENVERKETRKQIKE